MGIDKMKIIDDPGFLRRAKVTDFTKGVLELPKQVGVEILEAGYQRCPICEGKGFEGMHTNEVRVCDVCKGKKIINKLTGGPPQ